MSSPTAGVLRRRTYPLLALSLAVVLLAAFGVATALQVPLLTDPVPVLRSAGPLAGALGVALLVADVLVPVPASLVMTAHGALFGPVVGASLSLLGGTAATLVAVWGGRRGRGLVARVASDEHRARSERLVDRYGAVAVVVTRPVPVLAETVAVVAGTAGMSLRAAALAGALGNVVPATLYALAGTAAVDAVGGSAVFLGVLALAGLLWLVLLVRARPGGSPPGPTAGR